MLEDVRRLYGESEARIIPKLISATGLPVMVRSGKTTQTIISKLNREHTRLHTMQDIAGCRLTVPNVKEQDAVRDRILAAFPAAKVSDFRDKPRHGYRAIHIIVSDPRPFEIQLRTEVQNSWAQLSEKLADQVGADIKYGGGPANVKRALELICEGGMRLEALERLMMEPEPDRETLAVAVRENKAFLDDHVGPEVIRLLKEPN